MTSLADAHLHPGTPHPAPAVLGAVVAGTGRYLPGGRLTNADIERVMDTSDAWIVERTGIRERRVAAPGEATAAMATAAARRALADAGMTADQLDLCLVATCTPDQTLPSAAALVSGALGLRGGAFDLAAACSGFVYALVTASALLATGTLRSALVVGAETLTRITDLSDRSTGMLFGDGAGAVILVPTDPAAAARPSGGQPPVGIPGLLAWDLACDGSAAAILQIPAGGSLRPATAETIAANDHVIKMEGREVYRRAVRAVVDSVTATLARAGVEAGQIDLFLPHQANARIVEAVLPRLGIPPERTYMNIERYGNTSAASIPIALSEAADEGRLHDGDLVLMTGFGAGMTWASALVRWGRAAAAAPA